MLMHPAFQHSQKIERELYPNIDGMKQSLAKFNSNEFAARALQRTSDKATDSVYAKRYDREESSDVENSSSSEEIDLTSNVCVDFTSNNHKNKSKQIK